jgi:hypothetical protein
MKPIEIFRSPRVGSGRSLTVMCGEGGRCQGGVCECERERERGIDCCDGGRVLKGSRERERG